MTFGMTRIGSVLFVYTSTVRRFGSNNYVAFRPILQTERSDPWNLQSIRRRARNCMLHHAATLTRNPLRLNVRSNGKMSHSSPSIHDYIGLVRPITILQAVGAFIVGRLVILRHSGIPTDLSNQNLANFMLASASIYFSYGAGMAMNDCVDASLDAQHGDKQNRSIASGRISRRNGCLFCVALTLISLIFSKLSANTTGINGMRFLAWNGLNLLLMAGYALGLQKIFLVKNLICGWLAISPLVGASLFSQNVALDKPAIHKLYQLAAIGFPLQVSREIIKDIEDMDTDNGEKQTLPLLIGETWSKRIAYGLVGIINVVMIIFPHYWRMFASMPPVHAVSVALGVPMCLRASVLPLAEGQQLLKKSIYVLLIGMIGGLLLQ